MRKKIAIIDPLGAHGSSHHFYLFGQARGLKSHDVDVSIYTNSVTPNPNIDGIKFYQLFGRVFSSNYKFLSGVRYIFGVVISVLHARFNRHNIFHFHIFYTNFLILFNLLFVKLLFGKIVLTVHDVTSFANYRRFSIITNTIYKLTDIILTHNNFSKKELVNKAPFLQEMISIVPHGNYSSFINIRDDKEKSLSYLDLPENKTILLFFGMIKKVKGLDVLLKAFSRVLEKHPDTLLLVAGRSWENDFAVYENIIEQEALWDNIILHERFIPYEDVEHYYCVSDLVVLPYKKIYQSGVLMMTLSYERPALVSDLPPLKEVITDNKNGYLFKSEDVNDLANKIDFILSDRKSLDLVRKNGNRLIAEKFCWSEIGRLTKKAYQSL